MANLNTHEAHILKKIQRQWHGTLKSYLIGFVLSLLLTAFSFFLVSKNLFSRDILRYLVGGFALLQAFIQLIFFLHVGQEAKPRFETITLVFTIAILVIIVVGSLFIMDDLDERMMPGMNMHDMQY
jgi:cytochrome o ubiquinol oxidase operon protein cyoD